MKNLLTLTLSLALSISVFANNEINSLLESGKLSEVSGDFTEAIKLYKKVIF